MHRDGRLDIRAAIALIMAIPIALSIVIAFSPFRNAPVAEVEPEPIRPRPKAKPPAPTTKKAGEPKEEQSLPVAPLPHEVSERAKWDRQLEQARIGCHRVSNAIAAYAKSPSNPGATEEERWPIDPTSLINPPFGGPSFLPNGLADLHDPWDKPYKFRIIFDKDGASVLVIHTDAPDGTSVSQFGIGRKAWPQD